MKVEQGEMRLGPGNRVQRNNSKFQYGVTQSVTVLHNNVVVV